MDPRLFIVNLVALGLCLWGESVFPFFMDRKERVSHGARNIAIGLTNAVILTLAFSGLIVSSVQWGDLHRFGILRWLNLPSPGLELWMGFVLFDLWMYGWHRANHQLPFFWRFHRVHHADPSVDSTTALRFHAGEMILSSILRLAVIPILGISLENLVLYELILEPVILFHHSNIAFPERFDRIMRLLVVSPNMHRVHHSDIPTETNSNYASIFSFWDRLWGTYCRRDSIITIQYGLKEFREPRWNTLPGILSIPF